MYFAPEALIDAKGRQIMWAWLLDNPKGERTNGWSGVYGLPRSLWLGDDGTLRMRPVKELETLRYHERTWKDITLSDGETKTLDKEAIFLSPQTTQLGTITIAVSVVLRHLTSDFCLPISVVENPSRQS